MITLGITEVEKNLVSNYAAILLGFGNMLDVVLGTHGSKYELLPVAGLEIPELGWHNVINIPGEQYEGAKNAWYWLNSKTSVATKFPFEPASSDSDRLPPPTRNRVDLIYQWYTVAVSLLSPQEKKQIAVNVGVDPAVVAKFTKRSCVLMPSEAACAKGFVLEVDSTEPKSRWCCPEAKKPPASSGPSIGKILFVVVVTGALVAGGYFLFVRKPTPSIEKQYRPGYFPGV